MSHRLVFNFLFLFSVGLFSCGNLINQQDGNLLHGSLESGLPGNLDTLYLKQFVGLDLLEFDTAIVVNGTYSFIKTPEEIGVYMMELNDELKTSIILSPAATSTRVESSMCASDWSPHRAASPVPKASG